MAEWKCNQCLLSEVEMVGTVESSGEEEVEYRSSTTQPRTFKIHKVINSRMRMGVVQYRVKWRSGNETYTDWTNEYELRPNGALADEVEEFLKKPHQNSITQAKQATVKRRPGRPRMNFAVDRILDKRTKRGGVQYLVRWEGYSPEFDSWEPITNLDRAKAKVEEYEQNI